MKQLYRLLFFIVICTSMCSSQTQSTSRIHLPNGWHLTPAGNNISLGDLPLNIAVAPNGTYAAVTNNGEGDQSIELVDINSEQVTDSVRIEKSWLGLQFSADSKRLYASGGNNNEVIEYAVSNKKLIFTQRYELGADSLKISATGLAVDERYQRLYVLTKEDSSLYAFDLSTRRILKKIPLSSEGYTCILSPDKSTLYISAWGNRSVLVYNTQAMEITGHIAVGSHPNDLCLTKDGKFLFVANANDNSVSVIGVQKQKVIETLNAALYPDALEGSTTNSVALSEDGRTLYIANADNNCLAVFDVAHPGESFSKGFIPTGWYPTCVRVVQKKILVANGKGFQSFANPNGPNPTSKKRKTDYQKDDPQKPPAVQYIGSLMRGTMSVIREPDEKQLAQYSQEVYKNTPYAKDKELVAEGKQGNPVPMKVGDPSPIRHVFYIIKENRTYDQVLGDDPRGNGDTSLCLFPKNITPNEHALAEEFVLLDNFYVDAEVSADGHNWSMAAYATDYVEKIWPTQYGGRGGEYDYAAKRGLALPGNGYIWDNCLRHKVTFRNYGEFMEDGPSPLPDLISHTAMQYPGWDLSIQDTTRERIWEKDFDSLVTAHALPQFNIIYLPNDHTSGLSKKAYTPFAAVADNDLALGKLIDHLSHSSVWNKSAVFVLEDDAQNGPDHVDAHRSIAFVAGGFVKRHAIDHTMYSTSSMMRTMELILGLPPMSQYDAAAQSMWRCFSDTADLRPFTMRPSTVDLNSRNTTFNNLMRQSDRFDFTHADNVPDAEFTRVLWQALKGEGSEPPITHSAFVRPDAVGDDD